MNSVGITKVFGGMVDAIGSMLGTSFPGIDPQTGNVIAPTEDQIIKAQADSKEKQVSQNMKQWLLLTGIGGAVGAQVAGDGMVPDAWIGPVPLEIVTYFDFAESDSVVKYRAFGGEYFAHQGGDKNAMRVDFLLVGPYKDIIMNVLRLLRFYSKSQQVGQGLFNTDESFIKQGPNMGYGEALWNVEKVTRRRAKEVSLNSAGLSKLSYSELVELGKGSTATSQDDLWDPNTDFYDANLGRDITQAEWDAATQAQRKTWFEKGVGSGFRSRLALNPLAQERLEKTGFASYRKGSTVNRFLSPTAQERNSTYYSLVPNKNVDPSSIQKYVFQDQKFNYYGQEYVTHGDQFYELQNMGYYQFHYNYPVIVKNHIFNGMWIETVQFTQEAKNGIDAIQGHLLLRKYMRPPKLRWNANGKNITGLAYKETQIKYQENTSQNIKVKTPQPLTPDEEQTLRMFRLIGAKGNLTDRQKIRKIALERKLADYWAGKETTVTVDKSKKQSIKYETMLTDKKVWVWEEKRDDTPQIAEIVSNVKIGITKAAFTLLANGIGGKGVGASNWMSFEPDSVTQVASRVLV